MVSGKELLVPVLEQKKADQTSPTLSASHPPSTFQKEDDEVHHAKSENKSKLNIPENVTMDKFNYKTLNHQKPEMIYENELQREMD